LPTVAILKLKPLGDLTALPRLPSGI